MMRFKLKKAVLLAVFIALPAIAEEHGAPPPPVVHVAPAKPVDVEKVSYALGMKLGIQRKQSKSDLDVGEFMQGLKDLLEGKPTRISETNIMNVMITARDHGTNQTPKDKLDVAYSSGLRMAEQLKNSGAEVHVNAIAEGIKDVIDGKPTKIKETEIPEYLQQASEAAMAKKGATAKIEGEAFLAKHLKEPGVQTLPDGLQYEILKEGTGRILTTNDHIFIKWRGLFIDGREFEHHNHFPTTPGGGFQCWQDALQRMKVGSKWKIVAPPALSFGSEGEPHYNVPPESTVIFELEVREIVSADDPRLGLGRMGHGIEGRDDP